MIQKVKDKFWTDEAGKQVPVEYVNATSRLKERHAATILREAQVVSDRLKSFKELIAKLCDDVYKLAIKDLAHDVKLKGNFTWFNFDRSIKIELSISERVEFEDLTIQTCKAKLDEFLSANIDAKTEFLKEMVTDAFSTSKGQLDAKKVMGLMRYRTKIKDPLFQDAMDLLSDSIRRPDSKRYFRVWRRDESGEYQVVDLNFSSI